MVSPIYGRRLRTDATLSSSRGPSGQGRNRAGSRGPTNYSENQGSDFTGFIPAAPSRHERDRNEAIQTTASTNGEDARTRAARTITTIEPRTVMRMRSV